MRIPSVSAPPSTRRTSRRAPTPSPQLLRGAGLPRSRSSPRRGPTDAGRARGRRAAARRPAGAPTVLLYAHHDVQPPGDPAPGRPTPFEPTERDGRLYGRGAADDKAGIVAHLGALRALGDDARPSASRSSSRARRRSARRTSARSCRRTASCSRPTSSSSRTPPTGSVGVPALTTSLRGLVDSRSRSRSSTHAVHSGMFGGAGARRAHRCSSRLLATLHDDAGDVAVAGLAPRRDPDVDYDEADFRADAGLLDGVAARRHRAARPRGCGPSPRCPSSASTRRASRRRPTRIAAAATAKLSLRIAAGQDPAAALAALRDHLRDARAARRAGHVSASASWASRSRRPPTRPRCAPRGRRSSEAWGVAAGRHRRRRVHPVHRRPARGLPGRRDPRDRRRGPGLAGARRRTSPCTWASCEQVVLAEALLLVRLGELTARSARVRRPRRDASARLRGARGRAPGPSA